MAYVADSQEAVLITGTPGLSGVKKKDYKKAGLVADLSKALQWGLRSRSALSSLSLGFDSCASLELERWR